MKKLNVLILGHASFIWGIMRKFSQSELLNKIFIIAYSVVPHPDYVYLGSPKNIKISDLKKIIKEYNIDFVMCMSNLYSDSGFYDFIKNNLNMPVVGISKTYNELETSKLQGKKFMEKYNIKMPDYIVISSEKQFDTDLKEFGFPIVIKNNSLQLGFGSYICYNKKEALNRVRKLLKKSDFCIAEKFISGTEITRHYIWDENSLIPLNPVKDFKKLKDGNTGINTGGLACYSPVKLNEKQQELLNLNDNILKKAFLDCQPNFTGIFCTNLLFSENECYTLEFNMRPGISEFEVLIENMNSDLLQLFYKTAIKQASNVCISYKNAVTGCIVLTHKNYKKQKPKNRKLVLKKFITNVDDKIKINFNCVFTDNKNKDELFIREEVPIFSVINTDKINPFPQIYQYVNSISDKNLYYRKDIDKFL